MQVEVGNSLVNVGDVHLQLSADPKAAREEYQEAVKLREEVVAANPQNSGIKRALAFAYYRLATACLHAGDREDADELYAKALPIYKEQQLVIPYILTLARLGQHVAASERADKLLARRPGDRSFLIETACCYALCASAVDHPKAEAAPGPKKSTLAAGYTKKAMGNLREATMLGWKDPVRLESDLDLAPLREDPEFEALAYEISKQGAPAGDGS